MALADAPSIAQNDGTAQPELPAKLGPSSNDAYSKDRKRFLTRKARGTVADGSERSNRR